MLRSNTKRKSNITSIVELFIMFLLLLIVIVVITMVCMTTRQQSLHAHYLNDAVICAENVAEVTKTASDTNEAAQMLADMDGVSDIATDNGTITAKHGEYTIEIKLTPDNAKAPAAAGVYVDEDIAIYHGSKSGSDSSGALYDLHTGYYSK